MPHRYFLFKKHTIQFRFFLIFIFNKKSFIINTRNTSIDFLPSYQSYKVIYISSTQPNAKYYFTNPVKSLTS